MKHLAILPLFLRLALPLCAACLLLAGVTLAAGRVLRANAPEIVYRRLENLSSGASSPIYSMDVERRLSMVLFSEPVFEVSGSPNGNWLVINPQNSLGLYRMRFDGTEIQRITSGHHFNPVWSPDGEWLIFLSLSSRNNTYRLHRVRPDGTEAKPIIDDLDIDSRLVWSPDGQWLAFSAMGDANSDIYIVHPDGTDLQQITDDTMYSSSPVWSPDGQWIVFLSAHSGGSIGIYKVRPNGSDLQVVVDYAGDDYIPVWSPDGQWLAFSANCGVSKVCLYRAYADGSNVQQIIELNLYYPVLVWWSPDGQWLAFISDHNGLLSLYRVRPNGSDLQRLFSVPQGGAIYDITWRP